jgi:hypothetical protein
MFNIFHTGKITQNSLADKYFLIRNNIFSYGKVFSAAVKLKKKKKMGVNCSI